ncbi:MAG: CDP-archaeol synthase [Marinobacter sp.]|nr:CDP-archaeol synthase [Marinobacter sp.]
MTSLILLAMLVAANGAPVLARRLLRGHWATPIDGGALWADQRPILGASKTWRGLVAGCVASALVSGLAGWGLWFGALFGALALAGDLLSSFIKRRLGLPSSARATGLDQIPEALIPCLFAAWWLPVGWLTVVSVTVLFMVADIVLSPWLHELGIRREPH